MAIHFRKLNKIGTNVRLFNLRRLVTRAMLKLYWNISPSMAKRLVKKHFFKPADYRTTAAEKQILGKGSKFEIDINYKTIQGWKWGKGPGILFVHGWNGRGIQFYRFFQSLRRAGFAIITFDAPGHGESTGRTSSYFEWTDTVRAMLNPRNGHHIRWIIAHSLGGSAVINALSKEKVSVPTVLIAPALKLKQILFNTFNLYGIPSVIYRKVIQEYEHRFGYTLEADNPANLLPEIDTDIFIVHDQQDEAVPFLDSEELCVISPKVRLFETDGLGHKRILTDRKIIQLITEYIIDQSIAVRIQHSDLDHHPAAGRQPGKVSAVQPL